jgi:8-hydroxy-5-deazaflavin:NADPH oxidoreductase
MNIGIIGAGSVGGTLGRRFSELGHSVTFGVRDAAKGVKGGAPAGARLVSVAEAGRVADVVILTVPGAAAPNAIRELSPPAGQVVVDATNPLASGAGGMRLDVGPNGESAAERLAAMAPAARVVKAFNTTGANNMANPVYGGEPTVMFYAGDDRDAKATVHQLAAGIGFDAVDAGPLSRSRELEHLAFLWISLAYGGMGRDIAFKLARR